MYNRRSSNTNSNSNSNTVVENGVGVGIEYGMESSSISSSNDNVVVLSSTTSTSTNLLENNSDNNKQTQTQTRTQTQKMIYIHKKKYRRFFVLSFITILICIWGLVGTWMVIELHDSNSNNNNSNKNYNHYYHDHNHPLSSLFRFQFLTSDEVDGSIINHNKSSSQKQKQNHKNEINQQKQQIQTPKFQLLSKDAPKCHKLSSPNEISITLVTQISHDRLWMMEHHCNRYPHRISIAVYTNNTYEEILQELTDMNCITTTRITTDSNGNNNNNNNHEKEDNENKEKGKNPFVDVAILDARIHGSWNDYPVNELRNLALQNVQTTHILYLDVDFWPNEHFYETIMGTTTTNTVSSSAASASEARLALFNDPKQALVIPAFQLWRQCKEWKDCRTTNLKYMARTLKGLAEGIKEQQITMFDPTNRGGHGSTDYRKWFHQSIGGSILPIPCFQSNRYEPFVIIRYCQEIFPPFQSEFAGYGKNKVTWMMQVIASGFIFSQVGGVYVLHYPHLDSLSRQHWNEAAQAQAVTEKLSTNNNYNDDNNNNDDDGEKSLSSLLSDEDEGKKAQNNMEKKKKLPNNNNLEVYKRGQVDTLYFAFKTWLKENIPFEQKRVNLCEDAQDDDSKLWIDPKLKKKRRSGH